MPVDCSVCFGRGAIWCRFDESDRIVIPALPDDSLEGRPDWCPLVEVPVMNVGNSCSEIPNNSDSVSRQTAVEAIANQSRFSAEEIINICDKSVQDENGWLGGLKEAILAVLELPSAQPEIIRCKECVYADENYHCDYMTTWNDGDCFCCYGKRRTDGQFDKQTGGD